MSVPSQFVLIVSDRKDKFWIDSTVYRHNGYIVGLFLDKMLRVEELVHLKTMRGKVRGHGGKYVL